MPCKAAQSTDDPAQPDPVVTIPVTANPVVTIPVIADPDIPQPEVDPEEVSTPGTPFPDDPSPNLAQAILLMLRGAYVKVCRTILQGCVRLRRDIRQLESEVSN